MQKLQDSVFSIVKTTNLSSAVFSFLQPSENADNVPLGGILSDTRNGWLALGPKFCVVDLKTGLKIAAHTFGVPFSNANATVTCVIELPTPLTSHSKQLIISIECEDLTGLICILHVNGSQILRCIQTDVVITELAVCDDVPDGPLTCFDGVIMAGSKRGEIFAFDLNRASLIQALKDISQGYEHLVKMESNPSNLAFLSFDAIDQIEQHRDQALDCDDHLAIILNENSLLDGQYLFRNPDGSVRMKAKRDHIKVSSLQYIPQLGSLAVGYNFGAFQIWNMMTLELEFASQVNRECLPVTQFGFQEPCDDPRAFCYLWAVFSVVDRFEEEEFPLAVMYSLTYQGKRMLSDTKCLYQEFLMATIRFQVELSAMDNAGQFVGGKCVSCHTYSISSTLGEEGEDSMLNICQLVWECWGENINSPTEYGMLLFDLDQWYKDQMPATYPLQNNAFMSASWCGGLFAGGSRTLDARLCPASVTPYSHATRLEEHFYPNSIHYDCICLTTSEASVLSTIGIQRQIIASLDEAGPTALLNPPRLYSACVCAGLTPLSLDSAPSPSPEDQRRFLLSVALEARLSRFLKRCAHDWATGSHAGVGCTLPFLVDWCWRRALELKENAKELTAPLFTSSSLPDRNVVRCLEHCVQQLTQLTGLLDAILTKCCNMVVPDALSEIEEKFKGVGTVSLYFQVVQWFLRVGLLPERNMELPYPVQQLENTYNKRRLKLHRLQENAYPDANAGSKSCSLLYIDQLIEHEFGGERIRQAWIKGGSENNGLYPPPSLYSLLRLYLLPDIAEEHKHSLVLYLLVDYSMVYDEVRYEAVVRRLMQFPTMFGLSNTAIKATQAFWHLDHRDFDFALDQLQCLTGNTLSEWQHHVVLSSLLAQKMTQAALQYLHVRKPAPIQNLKNKDDINNRVNDHDKLEDWQSCCNLYLARELVFEALDVVRMCAQNAASLEDKLEVLNFFFKGCRNSGQLSKILQVTLLPFEEEAFIRYLERCNDTQTSDILIMYYLQQARFLEAQQHNNKMRINKRPKDVTSSAESILGALDREGARDAIVELVCSALPSVANKVAVSALSDKHTEPHIFAPKPMSVFIQALSPKNTFTYKSSFIQDTIENASEIWVNRPKMRRGIKRALNIEETPFICTPKLSRSKSIFSDFPSEGTPPKRLKLDLTATPRTPKFAQVEPLSRQMAALLDMPEVQSPDGKLYDRSGAGTPHSILKTRRNSTQRDAPSPVDSRYLGDSDDELLETASNHTHYSDSTNKHLRFTIPTASESGSTPSPLPAAEVQAREQYSTLREKEMDESIESYVTTTSTHAIKEPHPLESPPKKLATEEKVSARKSYKDNVRARRSLSISANSSLSEDPNTSIESIADIPITLVNPRYGRGEGDASPPRTPTGRRGIRSLESTPLGNRSRSGTPERIDSPIVTPRRSSRTNSRSRTPSVSPRPLAPISEQPTQEAQSEPHTVLLQLRNRPRTPERLEKLSSPRLAPISESPTKAPEPRAGLRSRSRTPELEPEVTRSPRILRSSSKTPEKVMSPKVDRGTGKAKKSLSRIVLEANAFSKTKNTEKEIETPEKTDEKPPEFVESTPMKPLKLATNDMDVSFSPINKSVLTADTSEKDIKSAESSATDIKPLPNITKINETQLGKSVLQSYESSVAESSNEDKANNKNESVNIQSLPVFTSINESMFAKSVLHSYESSVAESSSVNEVSITKEVRIKTMEVSTVGCKSVLKDESSLITNDSDSDEKEWKERFENAAKDIQKEKERIVDIQREINEIEEDMSEEEGSSDEEIIQRGDDMSTDESEDDDDEDNDVSMSDNEVISISTSSSEESMNSDSVRVDEQTSSESNQASNQENLDTNEAEKETVVLKEDTETSNKESTESVDPLNQGQVSLLTDDNSYMSDNEISLNYSDDDEKHEKDDEKPGVQHVVNIDVIVEEVSNDNDNVQEQPSEPSAPIGVDVVDTSAIIKEPAEKPSTSKKDDNPEVGKADDEKKAEPVIEEQKKSIKDSSKEPETENPVEIEENKPQSRTRKRITSTSSNKSTKDKVEIEKVETEKAPETPKTPVTRKRAKSIASNQSEEELTPSKPRAKTPEVRKILTRRASKEIELLEESKEVESPATPQRRSTRTRSKNIDDNASVASEESVRSTKSKASEKSEPVRKGRKSIVAVKPELSAIPELSVEDSRADVSEYTDSRRLTRHQKTVLSSHKPASVRRRRSASADSGDEPAFDVQPIDRISLLNTGDFEGSPDSSELHVASPISVQSESGKRTPRASRAASESKTLPIVTRAVRRASVDVAPESPAGSPAGSVTRAGRRASFTRACEALHTPKRRADPDRKKDTDSQPGSPAGETAARRPRRASTQSNASGKSDTSRSTLLIPNTGSPDSSELHVASPISVQSESGKRTPRASRAASESKTLPIVTRAVRRASVDVAPESPAGSPAGSVTRAGRRASFTRACEALHTPKRRADPDRKKDTDSQPGSPAGETAARRPRRASTQSNASGKSDTSRRSKKRPAVEESDAKK